MITRAVIKQTRLGQGTRDSLPFLSPLTEFPRRAQELI
jgi:hypothetical protein